MPGPLLAYRTRLPGAGSLSRRTNCDRTAAHPRRPAIQSNPAWGEYDDFSHIYPRSVGADGRQVNADIGLDKKPLRTPRARLRTCGRRRVTVRLRRNSASSKLTTKENRLIIDR